MMANRQAPASVNARAIGFLSNLSLTLDFPVKTQLAASPATLESEQGRRGKPRLYRLGNSIASEKFLEN